MKNGEDLGMLIGVRWVGGGVLVLDYKYVCNEHESEFLTSQMEYL